MPHISKNKSPTKVHINLEKLQDRLPYFVSLTRAKAKKVKTMNKIKQP